MENLIIKENIENVENVENNIIKNKRGRKKVEYGSKTEMYKKYNSTYYEKHKSDEGFVCPVCNGKYRWFNRSHHNKSKKHLKKLDEIKNI